jgi:hypothetical protein
VLLKKGDTSNVVSYAQLLREILMIRPLLFDCSRPEQLESPKEYLAHKLTKIEEYPDRRWPLLAVLRLSLHRFSRKLSG